MGFLVDRLWSLLRIDLDVNDAPTDHHGMQQLHLHVAVGANHPCIAERPHGIRSSFLSSQDDPAFGVNCRQAAFRFSQFCMCQVEPTVVDIKACRACIFRVIGGIPVRNPAKCAPCLSYK